MSQTLESPDSSSPKITRSIAAAMQGEFIDLHRFPAWQRIGLNILGRFPPALARFVVSHFTTLGGIDPALLQSLSIEELINERLQDYTPLLQENGRFPAAVLGAGLGGATAHLSLAVGGLFLPQTFVSTLAGGSADGNIEKYLHRSIDIAHSIAKQNPSVLTIQHFDPVHDGWITRYANHLRLKLLHLPETYRHFMRERLEPGGLVLYLNCTARWLRYRLGERSVFQVGGWGGIPPHEFLEGSKRLEKYCADAGLKHCGWKLDGYPLEWGPESEWGCEPSFGESIREFCEQEGFRFLNVSMPQPHDYSRLAYRAYERLLEKEGRAPAGVFVEMFSQYDATAVHQAGLLPLWLVFHTSDSLEFLQQMRSQFPEDKPVFFSPLSTFAITPDVVPWEEWALALQGLDWRNVGARPSHYPADALAVTNWYRPLHAWARERANPIRTTLGEAELSGIVARLIEEKALP